MVTEYNDLVTSGLMQSHKVVARHVFVGVVPKKSLFHLAFFLVVFLLEFHSHLTPYFNALYFGQVTSILELDPIGFIKLRANLIIDI